jgi:hypothetical protein
MYNDSLVAARVYDQASRLMAGVFAGGLNFPDEEASDEIKAIVRRYIERNEEAIAFLHRVGRWQQMDA